MKIIINKELCIKCGRCVEICPTQIFIRTQSKELEIRNVKACIACGHCVGVCPQAAISHSEFPVEKIHSIDREKLPTPKQVLLLCQTRRSNRAFSQKPIPQEALNMILEAAHRAPTAKNRQLIEFTLITDRERIHQTSAYAIEVLSKIAEKLQNPLIKIILKPFLHKLYALLPQFIGMKKKFDKGNDPILRNATAVIFFHAPKNQFSCHDANLAYQNASLMASSLGIAHFYTGFVCAAIEKDHSRRLAESFGIEGEIYAGMALAMPKFDFKNYIDKKDIKINRI